MEHVMCSNSLHLCDDVTQPPLFYGHYASQPMLAGTSSYELEDFVGAKFYSPHALAGGNQRIWILEKALEFSSAVLSTVM